MARAGSAVTVTVTSRTAVALCVGLATLTACAGVEVDEHASPATTEPYQATGRARSSTATGTSSTSGSTAGTAGTGTAGPSSSWSSPATATAIPPPGTSTSPTSDEAPGTSTADGDDTGDVDEPAEPFGFGQDTTGGAGGPTVTVSSSPALVEAAAGDEPLVIEVAGTVALDGMVPVGSNKTVVGVAATAEPARLVGGGLHIDAAENVIVQDLVISGSAGDDIDVDGATDVWIDHNDLSAAADGALDIGGGSDRVTVSWNHFHDQDQTTRVGHGDAPAAPGTDRLRVTYHHNWFQGTARDNPSVRLGHPVHVVNNYFSDIPGGGEGVTSSDDAGVLVEANAFENVADPFHPSSGAGDPSAGSLAARDNHLEASGEGRTGGTVVPLPYVSTPDPATTVEAAVTTGAGPRSRPLPDAAEEGHDGGVAG